ncbi:hypothetical protein MSP8886_02293 [Marinomonas spartinae]|uniref:Adhesin n=1 Tax=Marinomonas spartinae TaxID=1792290 RepID=A0A1A8TF55_9GAMM|nr:hypothetical protein [Marinomonas spartinae]SBS31958.1 hypothetical protein MSP8886_02293 [Marinomonas spartinae]
MAKRNRSTLKNYFRQGTMPSAEHFADLIDSCVNQVEEGFVKPPVTGLQLTALDQQHLLSFYQQSDPNLPLWQMRFAKQQTDLQFRAYPPITQEGQETTHTPNLTLTIDGKAGIQTDTPKHTLDVHGVIGSQGRIGSQLVDTPIPANGQWHDITPELEGCNMLEVVAGIGIRHSGRYALLHAIATNTCAPNSWWWQWRKKNPIKTQHAFFHSAADKLKLRWKQTTRDGSNRPYVLQIRTNTNYGEHLFIRYHITQLWHDPFMTQCESRQADEQASS